MKYKSLILFSIGLSSAAMAQEVVVDSIKTNQIAPVVVTGQFEPQSIKKSVFNVTRISKEDIKNQAANNLSDVLNQYLNIRIMPDSGTGRSTVSIFGLDANYFKILVDNIPLVNDTGSGNNIDLTQVNLDDIEQIEIIEGSMGVTHGANAVSGVLNIITKKSSQHKWEIATTLQEETVGKEYQIWDKGRHIQSAKISHSISDNWFVSVGLNRNDLNGFLDKKKGKDYAEGDFKRGYTWLPKLQYLGNGTISYRKKNFNAFYKFDYLNENIDFYNPVIAFTSNPPFGTSKTAKDQRYITERFYHHLNFNGKLFRLNYNISFSHQKQQRDIEYFLYDLDAKQERDNLTTKMQSSELLYSTGTVSNFFSNDKVALQVGYEISNDRGFAIVDGEDQKQVAKYKRLENYDLFVSTEIKATSRLAVRAGLRASAQSVFDDQYASSLGLRYLFDNGIELRTSLGQSYRTPTFDELYSKIKFSGHNFFGNENLIPETSTSYDLGFKKMTNFASGVKLSNNVSTAFMNVDDRIDSAFVGDFPGTTDPVYQYINISKYQMWNVSTTHEFAFRNLTVKAGISFVGISQLIDNGEVKSDDKFLYALQANGNLVYSFPKINMQFSATYKYNGKQQQFVYTSAGTYEISNTEAYDIVDASIRKTFFRKRFETTIGARNIFDVTSIKKSLPTGGAHESTDNLLLGYGRSYFIKLTYNLNF